MEIKVNTVSIAALVYMYLGVVVFFIGWLKTGYALAACLILGAGFLAGARSRSEERRVGKECRL